MLEVGGVVDARGQQHDGRHRGGGRSHGAERGEQLLRVLVDRQHVVAGEERRELPLHRGAVLEHVAGARRRAQVVLEHQVLAVLVAHDVDSGDVRVHPAGRLDADHLAAEVPRAEDELRRDPAVAQDPLAVVDVGEEQVERAHPLYEAAFDVAPLVPGDHARDQVEGEDPLEPLLLAVDREADPLVEERGVDRAPALLELLDAEPCELVGQHPVVRARQAGGLEHLVEERARLVAAVGGEHRLGHRLSRRTRSRRAAARARARARARPGRACRSRHRSWRARRTASPPRRRARRSR